MVMWQYRRAGGRIAQEQQDLSPGSYRAQETSLHPGRRPSRGSGLALPGCAEQGLDPVQAIGKLGHIGFGRALLTGLQGERELTLWLQAPPLNACEASASRRAR
jgi:hypothetical protein